MFTLQKQNKNLRQKNYEHNISTILFYAHFDGDHDPILFTKGATNYIFWGSYAFFTIHVYF